ncbi:MAG: Rne/Rng family ribonuclease [Actinomycetota bacterium]|nr:Rne/Rng family ribonuclease [Actinomycetota bacterium]
MGGQSQGSPLEAQGVPDQVSPRPRRRRRSTGRRGRSTAQAVATSAEQEAPETPGDAAPATEPATIVLQPVDSSSLVGTIAPEGEAATAPEGAPSPLVAQAEAPAAAPVVVEPAPQSAVPETVPSTEQRRVRQPVARRRRKGPRRARVEQVAPLGPRKMLIAVGRERSQIAVLEGRELVEHYVAQREDRSIVGNVYVGRVQNVLPGMEAAFLDIGELRNAVLYVGEVSYEDDVEGPSPRIETLLKSGQSVLAQVTKDPMGSKGARLTTEVSIAGRYLVLVPQSSAVGISRRLADQERKRLREIATRIRPEGHGLIVRTAAEGASEQDLERDVSRLVRIWGEVLEKSKVAKPPKLVYSEPPLAIRVVRDLFTANVEQVIVDDEAVYNEIRDYLNEVTPELGDRVELYRGEERLFERYNVTEQVRKAIDRRVWLPSGGHIVIDRTEAMTVIDVNTGRFVGRSTLEDTVLRTNLEAAEEIAKQLRLRDIGGIIVVDFIDMGYEHNRAELLRVFNNALLRDKTRTQVYGVSELGLVQMTRKRVSDGLLEAFSQVCEVCEGRGVILTDIT